MLKLPPPIWALIYVLLATAAAWALGWPSLARSAPLGIALTFGGWILPVWAIVLFRRAGTETNPTSPANKALVVAGPYRFTRNPMYLGVTIVTLGIAIWVGSWPLYLAPLATFATANFVHIPFEEAKMRRQFGVEFEDYTARIRRWL